MCHQFQELANCNFMIKATSVNTHHFCALQECLFYSQHFLRALTGLVFIITKLAALRNWKSFQQTEEELTGLSFSGLYPSICISCYATQHNQVFLKQRMHL